MPFQSIFAPCQVSWWNRWLFTLNSLIFKLLFFSTQFKRNSLQYSNDYFSPSSRITPVSELSSHYNTQSEAALISVSTWENCKFNSLQGNWGCDPVISILIWPWSTPVAQLNWPIPINAELANAKRLTLILHWPMPDLFRTGIYSPQQKYSSTWDSLCQKTYT